MMVKRRKNIKEVTISPDAASGGDPSNTLLPMLIWGLVLIVIGAVVVMVFV